MIYVTVKIGGIINQIAETTEVDGYTSGVLEAFIPDNAETWDKKKVNLWIKQNNERMEAICEFLNKQYEPKSTT